MLEKIKELVSESLKELDLFVSSITYENKRLSIVLDSDSRVLDLDLIVNGTRVINTVLDENDFIEESYELDVSSKEKGGK